MLQYLAIFVEHHAIIRLGDDPSLRGDLSNRFVHPMEGNQRYQGGNRSPLWRAGRGGREGIILQDPGFKPGVEWSANHG